MLNTTLMRLIMADKNKPKLDAKSDWAGLIFRLDRGDGMIEVLNIQSPSATKITIELSKQAGDLLLLKDLKENLIEGISVFEEVT
jgi:hypothetical protein